jgi:hypothetical protein
LTTDQREFKWVFYSDVLLCREAPRLDDDVLRHDALWHELADAHDLDPEEIRRTGRSGVLLLRGRVYEIMEFWTSGRSDGLPSDLEPYFEAFLRTNGGVRDPIPDPIPARSEWEFN